MKYNLYDLIKTKKEYTIKTSDSLEIIKEGWIGMIIEIYENNNALVEFDEKNYSLKYGLLVLNLDEVELYKLNKDNIIK